MLSAVATVPTVSQDRGGSPSLVGILARVGQGDQNALGELYDVSSSSIMGLVCRIVEDRAANQDELQGFNRDATNGMPYLTHLPNRTELFLVMPVRQWNE